MPRHGWAPGPPQLLSYGSEVSMVDLGPLHRDQDDSAAVPSFTEAYANWDLVGCTPGCRRPWRRRRWHAPRIWTCPGCRTRWTVEGRTWTEVMSARQLARLEAEVLGEEP
ncbi:hypothetical protein [Streptomyces sp. DH37]|uniref:hypothetical protein n=1 Tax=Streptomyces sp. DH37 TaxID=3040122 RepID=UPI0024412BA3|nr:hypothetical protein [Streptomyces sp. DH37]MDG9703789.1 hypothetical protein [Streptomyces sp. DH37]